jgi:hypothetical protein
MDGLLLDLCRLECALRGTDSIAELQCTDDHGECRTLGDELLTTLNQSERATSLASRRPLLVRFLKTWFGNQITTLLFRKSSGPANLRPLSRALPFSRRRMSFHGFIYKDPVSRMP